MKIIIWTWLMLGMLSFMTKGDLPPAENSYRILMLLPVSSKSHRNVFIPLAEALADRGHQIVMLSNNEKPLEYPNIKEINHGLPYFNPDNQNMFEIRLDMSKLFQVFQEALPRIAKEIYNVPQVKKLYEIRKEFDLIIVSHMFNEAVYPFLHEMPFITISTFGNDPRQSAALGNPINPIYMKSFFLDVDMSSVLGRFLNLLMHILPTVFWRNWAIVPLIQKEITAQFPELPPLTELERNLTLTLMNSHFSMEKPVPLLPSQVEIGGMHCRPGKSLPQDLKTWIEEAGSAGVVYFSLGSVAKGESMPSQYRNIFIQTFKKLKQKVIWKYEGDLDDVPENVLIRKWLPQQDILAHPNVKVFISHGGSLSTQEASYHGVPMLILPIFADQPKNGRIITETERGATLKWEEITVDLLSNTLNELISNPKYKKNMVAVSRSLRDQMESPKDRAVFWTEYVIRHNGAPHLKSPAAELSWVEFLMLDVLVLIAVMILLVFAILRWTIVKMIKTVFMKKKKEKVS